ncbi:gp24 [Enterobacter hormaechei]|nr:gp24 [Enterobacter hormaechei]
MGTDYYRTMEQGGKKAAAATRETQRSLADLNSQLATVRSSAAGLAGAWAGAFATHQLIQFADTWNQLNGRLRLASSSSEDYVQSQRVLMEISQRTGTSLEANSNLYSRIAQSLRDAGYASADVAKVTETIATSLKLSGASTEESDELYAQQYRVVSVSEKDDGTFSITGAWHDPDKYARIDTGAIIDQRPVSVIPPGNQSPPSNIVISSFSVVQQNISVETMRVSWDQAQNAIAYEGQWRRNDGNWVNMPRSSTTSFDVPGIYAGRYLVRVRAINAAEISSGWGYSEEKTLTGKVGNPPKPVGLTASENVVFGIELNWGFPANTDDTLKTEIQYSLTGTEDDAMLLADVPYPQRKYQQMGLKAGQIFWYRAQLVDRSGNESGYTEWVRGQASIDVSDITDAILEEIKDSDVFKDLIESAVDSSAKFAELSDAIKENADGLAAAVGSNKQTAEAIIGNALAIADVVVRQTAQQGANSATFEQLREVIATETEARVTDVMVITRLT